MLHVADEQLERYSLGRLPEAEVVEVEEHLLVCGDCVQKLEAMEQWTTAVRAALVERTETERVPRRSWLPVLALAALVLLAVGFVLDKGMGPRLAPMASLELNAIRGEMTTTAAAREYRLHFEDTPKAGVFRVQVVDAAGTSEFDEKATGAADGIAVTVPKALKSGAYFARLFGPDGQLLHEYGFRVK